ncbi:MAG: hypothetical protein HQ567_22355 [Candidatus Nealsonbacteria bacterium]|nr:hypothetical protein [Candidatus Nealsonbacteria bacterium]
MKQAIGVLAAAAVIMAGVWLVLNRSSAGEYMNHGKSNAFSDGTDYQGMWFDGELVYVVFVPPMVNVTSQSSQWPGMKPAPKGLTVIPEGLYNNGVAVATSESKRAFVLLASGKLAPLNVNEKLFRYMQLGKIENLETSPAWAEVAKVIRDAVDSEAETGAEQSGGK